MKSYDIKRVIEKLEPDPEIKYRLANKIERKSQRRSSLLPVTAIAASLVLIIGTGIFANYKIDNNTKSGMTNSNDNLNSLIALLPNSEQIQTSEIGQQDSSLKNSSVPSSDDKAIQNSGINSQDNNPSDSSNLLSPNTKAAQGSDLKPQDMGSASPNVPPSDTVQQPLAMNQPNQTSPKAQLAKGTDEQDQGIYIPKIQMPENPTAKMTGLIIYQNRIYLQSQCPIDWKYAAKLVDKKLGTTKDTITKQSNPDDYNDELASTIGIQDVYTVKGYDSGFRIMTYESNNKDNCAYFFDCLNDITVRTGNDIFGKFKMENNIESVQYEDYDSWNKGEENYKLLTRLDGLDNFLAALENSIPQEELNNLLFDQNPENQTFLNLKLKDGSQVQLRLFKEGYVYYNGLNILFKVDDSSFISFWNALD